MAERATPETEAEPMGEVGWREAILRALGDPLSRQLLLLLSESPLSATELIRSVSVPPSTLYRRLAELKQIALVDVQRTIITEDGKRMELYRSLLEEVDIQMRGGSLRVRARKRNLSAERLSDIWSEMGGKDGPV